MNNEQFRRLVSTNSGNSENGDLASTKTGANPRSLLGARPKSSVQMMGRSYGAQLFKKTNGTKENIKTKTSLPKGTKLAAGYIDRTQQKREDEEEDETAQRLKALEEQMKEGEIDEETFERLRDEITGGDISRTHLVKGLDRKLLERVRRGENVLTDKARTEDGDNEEPLDEDDAFDELEKHEVVAVMKEERVKQGEKAKIVSGSVAGQKRTRNQILADMKAQREAAKAAARPQLGTGFKKIRKDDGPRLEVDERGREVLITTDENGNVKRRVKKAKVQPDKESKTSFRTKEQPLGADVNVPVFEPEPEVESDGDIFENVGHDFNPLADLEDDGASLDEDMAPSRTANRQTVAPPERDNAAGESDLEEGEAIEHPATENMTATAAKNYFDDDPSSFSVLGNIRNNFSDPSVIAALAKSHRAQNLNSDEGGPTNPEDEARRKRHEAMLANRDRDMEDMDMGFGGSRFDDAEEMAMEGSKVKFSQWMGLGEEDDEDGNAGGGRGENKRKRGPKKKKGDKNSASDVMRVMEDQRKG